MAHSREILIPIKSVLLLHYNSNHHDVQHGPQKQTHSHTQQQIKKQTTLMDVTIYLIYLRSLIRCIVPYLRNKHTKRSEFVEPIYVPVSINLYTPRSGMQNVAEQIHNEQYKFINICAVCVRVCVHFQPCIIQRSILSF